MPFSRGSHHLRVRSAPLPAPTDVSDDLRAVPSLVTPGTSSHLKKSLLVGATIGGHDFQARSSLLLRFPTPFIVAVAHGSPLRLPFCPFLLVTGAPSFFFYEKNAHPLAFSILSHVKNSALSANPLLRTLKRFIVGKGFTRTASLTYLPLAS